MGGAKDFFFGSSPKVADPFGEQDRPFADFARGNIENLFGKINPVFGSNPLERSAAQGLKNFDPSSLFAGAFGGMGQASPMGPNGIALQSGRPPSLGMTRGPASLGGGAPTLQSFNGGGNNGTMIEQGRGLTSLGAQAAGMDQFGAGNALQRMLDPSFLDVLSDPAVKARNEAAVAQGQRAINFALPGIQSASQRASGGVANSSRMGNQIGKLASDVGSQVGSTIAGLNAQDVAQRMQLQQGAVGQGFNQQLGLGQLLGQLGLGMSGQGIGAAGQSGQLQLQQLAAMGQLGGGLQARQMQGYQFPFEQALSYLAAVRGVPLPGGDSQFANVMSGLGEAAKGGAAIAAASDRRLKQNIREASEEIQNFMDQIEEFAYEYVTEPEGQHFGVMAQDLEKTPVGKTFVIDTKHGKYIHAGLGFGAVLASLANLNRRVKDMEERLG